MTQPQGTKIKYRLIFLTRSLADHSSYFYLIKAVLNIFITYIWHQGEQSRLTSIIVYQSCDL